MFVVKKTVFLPKLSQKINLQGVPKTRIDGPLNLPQVFLPNPSFFLSNLPSFQIFHPSKSLILPNPPSFQIPNPSKSSFVPKPPSFHKNNSFSQNYILPKNNLSKRKYIFPKNIFSKKLWDFNGIFQLVRKT